LYAERKAAHKDSKARFKHAVVMLNCMETARSNMKNNKLYWNTWRQQTATTLTLAVTVVGSGILRGKHLHLQSVLPSSFYSALPIETSELPNSHSESSTEMLTTTNELSASGTNRFQPTEDYWYNPPAPPVVSMSRLYLPDGG
jgi:hypothetical protein